MTDPQAILQARARELARPPAEPSMIGAEELLTFRLARETYAVETRYVYAVFRLADITPLPGAEPPLYGLTPWRGDVLTVLDLRRLLGAPTSALDDLARVIVLGDRRPAFGILADALGETVTIVASELFALSDAHAGMREYARGVTRDAVVVLDAAVLLQRQSDSPS